MRRSRARRRARARSLRAHRAVVTNRVLRDPLRSCPCPETSETAEMPSDSSSPFTRGVAGAHYVPFDWTQQAAPRALGRPKLTLGASEILGGEFPVEQLVDNGLRVIGAPVLVVEVIRVLPDS